MYVYIGISGVFWQNRGVFSPLNFQEPGTKLVLFQAILTLSPAEAEPLKKTYVKLCDAYGILGNLRLNAGEVRLWSLFRLKLINLLIGCSPLHCPDNRMYISREDWPGRGDYHKNTSVLVNLPPPSQVYRLTGVKMCSLRGYQPDEERVVEITKLLTSGAAFFSWSHQGPSHTIDLTMPAQKLHR